MARLNFCAAIGLFLALAAIILMIFAEISQISSNQTVVRHIRMVQVDTSGLGGALSASGTTVTGLYNNGQTTGNNQGIKEYYSYGLWGYCAGPTPSGTGSAVYCSNSKFGSPFTPASDILNDVPTGLDTNVRNAIPNTTFSAQGYLRPISQAAFYLYFIGTILIAISFIFGLLAHRVAFLFSALFGIVAFIALAAGAIIWTIVIARIRSGINNATVGGNDLGITVTYGNALWMTWAAAGATLLSVMPFFFACCCGRRSTPEDYDDDYEKSNY